MEPESIAAEFGYEPDELGRLRRENAYLDPNNLAIIDIRGPELLWHWPEMSANAENLRAFLNHFDEMISGFKTISDDIDVEESSDE